MPALETWVVFDVPVILRPLVEHDWDSSVPWSKREISICALVSNQVLRCLQVLVKHRHDPLDLGQVTSLSGLELLMI